MMAYSAADQITQGTLARFAYNWPAAFVYNGVVYDNINMRLRGANGRYHLQGKRSMRFRFNDGDYFQADDQDGEPYPLKWRTLTTGKMFDNRQTLTYGLNEAVNMYLFNQIGVPASDTYWVHFRVIDGEEEAPDQWNGDFWGLNFVLETYDIRFLDRVGLEHGNLYKLINQTRDPIQQQRYQAPNAVSDGSDHDNIERNLRGSSTAEYIDAHVKLDKWYLYHSLSEAIRHYDMWPDANKNMVYYFEPDYRPENDNYGKLWILPWDTDGTWGPTWNERPRRRLQLDLPRQRWRSRLAVHSRTLASLLTTRCGRSAICSGSPIRLSRSSTSSPPSSSRWSKPTWTAGDPARRQPAATAA